MATQTKAERVERIQGGLNIKDDCFAYDKDKQECKALNGLYCLTEKCRFYKPKESVKINDI